jgi:hypothetical protein
MDANGDELARGGYERIGQKDSPFKTHGDVIDVILKELPKKPIRSASKPSTAGRSAAPCG